MTRLSFGLMAALLALASVPAAADDRTDRAILEALQAIRSELRSLRKEVAELHRGTARPKADARHAPAELHKKAVLQLRNAAKGHGDEEEEAVIIIEGPDGRRVLKGAQALKSMPKELRERIERMVPGHEAHKLRGDAEALRKKALAMKMLVETEKAHRAHGGKKPQVHTQVEDGRVIIEIVHDGKTIRRVIELGDGDRSAPRNERHYEFRMRSAPEAPKAPKAPTWHGRAPSAPEAPRVRMRVERHEGNERRDRGADDEALELLRRLLEKLQSGEHRGPHYW